MRRGRFTLKLINPKPQNPKIMVFRVETAREAKESGGITIADL